MSSAVVTLRDQNIADFGEQWDRYQDNDGYYGSSELFDDILAGLVDPTELRGRTVLDVGSGTGRIVQMILGQGAAKVHAVEPSKAMQALRNNTQEQANRVQYHQIPGDEIPRLDIDYALSIGVLHHIPQPETVVQKVFDSLRPGGNFLFWVYGKEGNETYLRWVLPLRKLTSRLPDFLLRGVCHLLSIVLSCYIFFCRFLPLPLRDYTNGVLRHFSWRKRFLVIFDQLNPTYAHYYTKCEAIELMRQGGFTDIQHVHRHGYSWTVLGRKPDV